jgi:alkanesulfonate monooxygenase SsuD/methylene tetrahydromethanopterin reductase-like flavin-dependent oxidoreductase (luciferase family)
MKLAYFMMPVHNPGRDYNATLHEDVAAIVLAEELGFDEAWVGEHYSSAVEQITSPMMFLAHVGARTSRIRLATGVICLPQYHPATIAGQAAMLDHLLDGRFIMGVGPGGLSSDFELFGVADNDRNEMMLESIDLIHAMWANGPPYDLQGKYWSIRLKDWVVDELGLGQMAKPYQKPHPPVAISVLSPYSGSIRTAARRGWQPLSANFVPVWNVKTHWAAYSDEMRKLGRTPDFADWRVARSIHIADSDDEAADYVKRPGGTFDWYFTYLYKIFERLDAKAPFVMNQGDHPDTLTSAGMRDNFVIYGSPRTVAEKLVALREELGPFGTLVMGAHDWQDGEKMRRSMRLLATEVLPAVNAAGAGLRTAAQ